MTSPAPSIAIVRSRRAAIARYPVCHQSSNGTPARYAAWWKECQIIEESSTASLDGTVKLWHAATGHERASLKGSLGTIWSVAFAPDCRMLATGGEEGSVKLVDIAKGIARAAQ